ncbi:restriction endonuclease-like protein [Paenibacillus tarimensis]|uniref:restriction endonuclease-like protein n=1 Tax=Paenibacillus tarimensis TaxID=416012 RepID=UPI001F3A77F4|nr:restriction endonuclease-like protein [Paenibacillus tarimensis]MCF2945443.1 restriction endonuclease-like protein [Paenibacillus tarimensis]
MASPHTGSPNPNRTVELLRIETNWFNLYLQGKPFHPTVEALQLHRRDDAGWVEARLQPQSLHSGLELRSIALFNPEQQALTDWQVGDACPPLFYETQGYELVVELEDDVALTFYHDNQHVREAVLPKGRRLLSGVLNFQNEVGYTELELRRDGKPVFRLQLEIFPSKLDYQKDYEAILHEVNAQIYNLSFDFLRRTFQLTGLRETRHQSMTEFFVILQHVFQQLVQTIERMQSAPHHRMRMENRLVGAARVKKAGRENIAFLAKRPHYLAQDTQNGLLRLGNQRYTPTHVLETKRHVDYDTMENRFVRWVLLRIERRLRSMKLLLNKKDRAPDPVLMNKLNRMQSDIGRLLKLDFLRVGEMRQMTVTLVLQMAPGYRDVYRYYLMLMKGLSIQDDLFRLSMKDLAQLYEYWCFLKIHELLSRKYELVKQDVVKLNRGGLFVTLQRARDSKMVYRNPRNGEVFTLYYNGLPPGDKSVTVGQKPDNVLTLKKQDAAVEYKYIFDAKYRINPAYEGTSYRGTYKTPGPQEEDINTMHRYRDAIVYQASREQGQPEAERTMFGAYVLFPYPNEEEYRAHDFYRSIELVNVGALPFLPSATTLVEEFLDELIMDSPEKAYERSTRPRGTDTYYADKMSGKTVLVGALSRREQLQDLLTHRFYHVPLRHFVRHGDLANLQVVGIYQSSTLFGAEQAGVRYYGRIKSWSILPREQIREIPLRRGAPTELYVKLEVEEWQVRRSPIVPGGHGVQSVLLTSAYMFQRAKEVAELRLETEEQLRDWREKRRLGRLNVKWDRYEVDKASELERLDVVEE